MSTIPQQADVISALIALPDLQQLTWGSVKFGDMWGLSDSRLLQQLTKLTGLELGSVAAEVLPHVSSLTKLQRLSMQPPDEWAAADYPGLQELQGLTSLELKSSSRYSAHQRFPACVSHLTALQQLKVLWATFPDLDVLTVLTALTKLNIARVMYNPSLLRLPDLQHLLLEGKVEDLTKARPLLSTSSLEGCTQLRCLSLSCFRLAGPGSLVASSLLQELDVQYCILSSGDNGPAAMSPWEVFFPLGPERLPHLTSLVLHGVSPELQQADVERLVACCSGLRELQLASVTDEQCSSLAQLTGLQALQVSYPWDLSTAGLRHLARLEQLTSLEFRHKLDSRKVSSVLLEQMSDKVPGFVHAIVNKVGADSWVVECGGGLTTTLHWRMRGGSRTYLPPCCHWQPQSLQAC